MSFRGIVNDKIQVVLTSADVNGALQAIAEQNVAIFDVGYEDILHICFAIRKRDLSTLLAVTKRRGERVKIKKRSGMINAISVFSRRPVLVLGAMLILFFSCWTPTRVFFVRIEGNNMIPTKQIIEQAKLCGIHFGAHRRQVRSEKMKNSLLESMPELQWAGINTYGCTAVITVRERNDHSNTEENASLNNIVALRDGVIREMTVQRGNALCRVGQVVQAGQMLVSAYTDCGIYIRASGAKAEIYGDTQRGLSVITPIEYCQRTQISVKSKKYSLILGKKRINFFKGSGISGSTCAKIYEEKYVTLPGGFVLPIGIICEQFVEYGTTFDITNNAETVLSRYAEAYLRSLMQAGEILRSDHVYFHGEDFCRLDGLFSCYEMIGITRPEEAKEDYE
jgi:similar to stage IV sporulation protein